LEARNPGTTKSIPERKIFASPTYPTGGIASNNRYLLSIFIV
jgi:hypothetical protein